MARDHKLDFSGYEPSTTTTVRPERNRSRSPKRPRSDSWRPSHSTRYYDDRQGRRGWGERTNNHTENNFRDRSPNNYRPSTSNEPKHPRHAKPQKQDPRSQKRPRTDDSGAETKGLSDKIHSLRRQLEKATEMPADIRQEKERELQGYIADQERRRANREKNVVTSRYHFVRFLERKKAERKLRKLEKTRESVVNGDVAVATDIGGDKQGLEDHCDREVSMGEADGDDQAPCPDTSSEECRTIKQEAYNLALHEAKVDLNYTLYAPLDQKYISLYPTTTNDNDLDSVDGDGLSARARRKLLMHEISKEAMNEKRAAKAQQDAVADHQAGIFRNRSGMKPPLWYEVEKAMESGTLEALRDGKMPKADSGGGQTLTMRSSMVERGRREKVPGVEAQSDEKDGGSEDDFFER
jgi:rRNA-processing protein Efg1